MEYRNSDGLCVSCHTQLHGKFCHNCGEKVTTSKDKSIFVLLGQFLNAFTFVDNKVFRTFKYFLFKPGLLTNEYIKGNRKKYILPISLFLMMNLVFFLINPVTDFNLSLYEQTNFQWYKNWAISQVNAKTIERDQTFDDYEKIYNNRSGSLSRSLILINVPLLAFLISLIYFKRERYFVDHFVFALHLFGFLLLNFVVWGTIFTLLEPLLESNPKSTGISFGALLLLILLLLYIFLAQKRCYATKPFTGIIKTLATFLGLFFILWLYRLILFIVVIWVT